MDKEKAKLALKHLIDRYNDNKHLKDFVGNEKQISRSLIEPFLRDVLGWNIEDPSEVKVEVPASGKRVDILVCLNGITQFIVEAKSLTQDIVDNHDFYKQTISYAHSKEKTFAILTNFKHFVILRCDVEVDNPLKAAIKIINIESYNDEDFDLLYNFSKEVWVEKGEENPLYLKLANYRRRIKVDIQLLEDLKEWRQSVINNVKKHTRHNKYDFSNEKEKYYVEEEIQRLIDRLIFVCYTEDKGFVDPELKSLIEQKKDRYAESPQWLLGKIRELFKKYWNDYNSDLFKFGDSDKFFIEDGIILKILTDLRKPKDRLPYDFASIEADILGKTYENFIGHVIAGEKRFKEKESKGKRKSEGIYYTPTYIVDYIARNTVKEYIKGKTIANINKVKILDPACGSGSFLIKAFDALIEECEKIRKLNYEDKKDIMLNCIFGVDKDERAVDICKLNLSLKLAERGQKLPPLHDNIKCGDSLIDDENVAGYKAFKWEEQFKEIMQNGGFDVVIGNPPYGADLDDNEKKYLKSKFNEDKTGNTASLFIFLGDLVLKDSGNISFIVPKQLTYTSAWTGTRKLLLRKNLKYVIDASEAFEDVELEQIIFIFKKHKKEDKRVIVGFSNKGKIIEDKSNIKYFTEQRFPLWITDENYSIFEKILNNSTPLKEVAKVNWGGLVAKYLSKSYTSDSIPCLRGREVQRYHATSEYFIKKKYIDNFYYVKGEKLIFQRIVCRYGEKIIANYRNARIVGTYANDDNYADKTVTLIWDSKVNLKFLLAIFNSKLINWFAHRYLWNRSQLTMEFMYEYARSFPLHIPNPNQEKNIANLADKMLSLNKKLQEIGDKNTMEKQKLEEEIKKTDNEIDELVYQLYGITEEEKMIIEESLK